jgi:thiazole synthase ThiGH ThiG subunit
MKPRLSRYRSHKTMGTGSRFIAKNTQNGVNACRRLIQTLASTRTPLQNAKYKSIWPLTLRSKWHIKPASPSAAKGTDLGVAQLHCHIGH